MVTPRLHPKSQHHVLSRLSPLTQARRASSTCPGLIELDLRLALPQATVHLPLSIQQQPRIHDLAHDNLQFTVYRTKFITETLPPRPVTTTTSAGCFTRTLSVTDYLTSSKYIHKSTSIRYRMPSGDYLRHQLQLWRFGDNY